MNTHTDTHTQDAERDARTAWVRRTSLDSGGALIVHRAEQRRAARAERRQARRETPDRRAEDERARRADAYAAATMRERAAAAARAERAAAYADAAADCDSRCEWGAEQVSPTPPAAPNGRA